ncbi:hypothetical protein ACKLTP_18610, partial [Paenarthrobacter ureafaciens]
ASFLVLYLAVVKGPSVRSAIVAVPLPAQCLVLGDCFVGTNVARQWLYVAGHGFDQFCHPRVLDAYVPMPALPDLNEDACVDELVEVFGG